RPDKATWTTAQGAHFEIVGRFEFPFLGNGGTRSIPCVISDTMTMDGPLFNMDQIRRCVPNCRFLTGSSPEDDELVIDGLPFQRKGQAWEMSALPSKMVCTILGESGDTGEDPDINLHNEFDLDLEEVRSVQLAEIPRILEAASADGCPELDQQRLKSALLKAVDGHVKCAAGLPPSRGELDFDIKLLPGAVPKKEREWAERNPEALKERIKWETNLLQTGRARIALPQDVLAISNVTTPKQGNKYRPCGAYTDLNAKTEAKRRDLPLIRDLHRDLNPRALRFFTSDISKGFYAVLATAEASKLTALWSVTAPGQVIVPTVMMFGPTNAPFCFDAVMANAMEGLRLKRIVDDLHGEGVPPLSARSEEEKISGAWTDLIGQFEAFVERC